MPVTILGINHKTAPVEIREKVAFSPEIMRESLQQILQEARLSEVAIVSTCNRMEVIFRGQAGNPSLDSNPQTLLNNSEELADSQAAAKRVIEWLAKNRHLAVDEIESYSYLHQEAEAVNHLMQVACGLDSMVLGEPQILGQVKDAFDYAQSAGTTGLMLNRLFQQTFTLAKQVRTDTQIGESAVSVAYAAVTLAKRIFSNFSEVSALFIGAGETIELAARHLANQGVVKMSVANRTVERAKKLASEFGASAYALSAIPELVAEADIIISSTASPVPIIGKGLMEKTIKKRRHRPMFVVDLAVPRDIESEVGELNDVYLYTVDDMQDVIQENLKIREEAAVKAQEIIDNHGNRFFNWLNSLSSVELMKSFRNQLDELRQSELQRAQAKIQAGEDSAIVMEELANRLSKKFMHAPSLMIRRAGEENDAEKLQVIAEIFDIASADSSVGAKSKNKKADQ